MAEVFTGEFRARYGPPMTSVARQARENPDTMELVKRMHTDRIQGNIEVRADLERSIAARNRLIAERIQEAKKDGVPHDYLAGLLGYTTRDGLTKFLRRNR